MARKYVLISLVSREKLTKEVGKSILSLFYKNYPDLVPQFANFYEPINKPILTVEKALDYWENGEFLCRRKMSIQGRWNIGSDRNKIGCYHFEYNWSSKVEWFNLFQKLCALSKSYFGYIHVITDNESEPAEIGSTVFAFIRGTASISLKKGIPQLGWGNYFGEEYVKEIDVDLLKKHGFEIEPLGDGYVFNITPQLSDVITDYEMFDKRRTLLKSLFRPGLFQKYETVDRDSDNDLARYIKSLEDERNKTS